MIVIGYAVASAALVLGALASGAVKGDVRPGLMVSGAGAALAALAAGPWFAAGAALAAVGCAMLFAAGAARGARR